MSCNSTPPPPTSSSIQFSIHPTNKVRLNSVLDQADSNDTAASSHNNTTAATAPTDSTYYIIPLNQSRSSANIHNNNSNQHKSDINTQSANKSILISSDHHSSILSHNNDRYRHDIIQYSDKSADYSKIPIQSFGVAMLRGMGWKDGESVGVSNKSTHEPITWKRRDERIGLGADKYNNNNDNIQHTSTQNKSALAIKKLRDSGRIISVDVQQLHIDALVEIIHGMYNGLYGRIISVDTNHIKLKLNTTEQVIELDKNDVTVLDVSSLPLDHPALHMTQHDDQSFHVAHNNNNQHSIAVAEHSNDTINTDQHSSTQPPATTLNNNKRVNESVVQPDSKRMKHTRPIKWSREQLIVRVVNKHIYNGTLYNEKCIIQSIVSSTTMTVKLLSTNELYDNIIEYDIETVIPRINGIAMILSGTYKSQLCTVIERSSKTSTATVQLIDELNVLQISYDDLCQIQQ